MKKVLLLLFFTAGQLLSQSNTANQEKISKALSDYFDLDRENIFLHLNKQTYLSDEKIWFKGYVTEKKTNNPYGPTANVYISLTDASGTVLQTKLYYAEASLFSGSISLPEKLPTGKYYLRVFTNFMNNFSEDESSKFPVYIIDRTQNNTVNPTKFDYKTARLEFVAEGGTFLDGISNTFAVKLVDCNGIGIQITDGQVKDASGNIAATFSTNAKGYGRFDLIASKREYTAHCTLNGAQMQIALPMPQIKGVTFSVNSYTFADKVVVTAKTNVATLAEIGNDNFSLVAGQEHDVAFADFSFKDKTEVSIALPSANFKSGINSIYLIDKNSNPIAQRIIYKAKASIKPADFSTFQKRGDSIVIKGVSPLALGSMSISVLPVDNFGNQTTIASSLLIDNFTVLPLQDPAYYFDGFSRKKHYELDCYLMSQKPKYAMPALLKNPPAKKFEFDGGLTIKGTVNSALTNRQNYKVRMNSLYYGLDETAPINEKNEFFFNNVMAIDSTSIFFSVVDSKGKTVPAKIHSQILNNNRRLVKQFSQTECSGNLIETVTSDAFPISAGAILLESIAVDAGKKKEVKMSPQNAMRFGNNMAKGYKITDEEAKNFRFLTDFIQFHGFAVTNTGTTIVITRTYSTSMQGSNSPAVYIDDSPIADMSILIGYTMDMVDEVYINRSGYGAGSTGSSGVIRVYTRRTARGSGKGPKSDWQELKILNAYQPMAEFKNPDYANVQDAGFKKYGTIAWLPNVETDEKGAFRFAFPNLQQQKVKIIIEGIDSNGQLYSETRLLEL